MLCAIALALLIHNYIEDIQNDWTFSENSLQFANCIILILLVVRFFHGNIVFINKNYFELKQVDSVNMFVDLALMLIQSLLIIGMSLIECKKAYDVVIALIFTDALWMLFVVVRNNTSCSKKVVSVAIVWLVSNLLTACIMLIFRSYLKQEETALNIINIIIVIINTIVNFYMCSIFCSDVCAKSE
jgi:hypothetical protein